MWLQNLGQMFKLLIAAAVVFCVTSLGIFFLQLRSDTKIVATQAVATLQSTQASLVAIQKDVDNIQVMTNATLFQAEEVLHHTDVYIATAQQGEKHQIEQLDALIAQAQTTVQSLDSSQKTVAADLDVTLHQTSQTIQDLQPLAAQLTATTKALQDTIQLTQPILKNSNDILGHVNGISADAQTEVHNLVYPPPKPWYAKAWGVTKLALRMLTIPLK